MVILRVVWPWAVSMKRRKRTRKQELLGSTRLPLPSKTGGAHRSIKRRERDVPRRRKHRGESEWV